MKFQMHQNEVHVAQFNFQGLTPYLNTLAFNHETLIRFS